jgi:hypothetical protein
MATNVTNQMIVDALRLLGHGRIPAGPFDTTGAQNTGFRRRLAGEYGVGTTEFEQAKAMASVWAGEQFSPESKTTSALYQAYQALRNRGLSQEQLIAVTNRALEIQRTQAGTTLEPLYGTESIGPKGEVGFSAFFQAANELAPGNVVSAATQALTGAGFVLPTTVAPQAGPPAGAPGARPFGGPRMQIAGPAPVAPAAGSKAQAAAEPTIAAQVAAGIQAGLGAALPKPATPAEIRAEVNAMYGWAAGLADIPEIAKILDDAAMGVISKAEVGNRFKATHYYKTTNEAGRNWKILAASPGDAAVERQKRLDGITKLVAGIGITMDPARLNQLTDLSLSSGWSETQISQFLANEIHYDPTRAKTGVLGSLKEAQRQYLVPLSDQAMSSWASAIVAGTKTPEEFDQYLRDAASSLFPALGEALKDPAMSTRKYLSPYGEVIAKTLGGNPEDIDWLEPKYQRFITQVDDKGARKVMPLADVQRTLMVDPLYGYDKTTQGQQAKSSVTAGLLKTFGFAT